MQHASSSATAQAVHESPSGIKNAAAPAPKMKKTRKAAASTQALPPTGGARLLLAGARDAAPGTHWLACRTPLPAFATLKRHVSMCNRRRVLCTAF